jgi:protein-S-isoprenylcysteine O-methyltransferase Ste14
VSASRTPPTSSGNDPAARANSLPWPPILYALTAAAAFGLEYAEPSPPFPDWLPWREIGGVVFLLGIALVIWASVTFKRIGTVINPSGVALHLADTGPYAYTRNPMYVAGVLAFLGAAVGYRSVWTLMLIPVIAVALDRLAIVPEERHLTARFGETYRAYCTRVRRWL